MFQSFIKLKKDLLSLKKVFKGNYVDVDFPYVKVSKGLPSNPGAYSTAKCELITVLKFHCQATGIFIVLK